MNAPQSVDRSQLQSEARILEQLLQQYIADRRDISKGSRRFIYFIDAHDLKAYLHIDKPKYLDGYILQAERAIQPGSSDRFIEEDVKLKSEQTLRWLLFEQDYPVILLPSHGEEIDEELAYLRREELVRNLGLVAAAERQIEAIKARALSGSLLETLAHQALQGDATARDSLVDILKKSAPAVAVLLGFTPDTTTERVEALIQNSRLIPLADVDWSRFQMSADTRRGIDAVSPSLKVVDEWRSVLSAVRSNTPRSNRLDAEALAYICALNDYLNRCEPLYKAVLVTRAMSLLHAIRNARAEKTQTHLSAIDAVRHTRLLPAPAWPQNEKKGEAHRSLNIDFVLRNLSLALKTYERQISSLRGGDTGSAICSEAKSLVGAWREFEGARFTLELRNKPTLNEVSRAGKASDAHPFRELTNWLHADGNLEDAILDSFAEGLRTFESDIFLKRAGSAGAMIARSIAIPANSRRVLVHPMIQTFLGPIALSSEAIEHNLGQASGAPALGEIVRVRVAPSYIDMDAAEAYLTWALIHASQSSWRLATIYAESAIAAAKFLRKSDTGREARLLLAQLWRLVGQKSADLEMDDSKAKPDRFELAYKLVAPDDHSIAKDFRFRVEHYALMIEQSLPEIANGWRGLELLPDAIVGLSAVVHELSAGSHKKLAVRALELRMIAACAIHSMGEEAVKVAKLSSTGVAVWHEELIRSIAEIRLSSEYTAGDIARQTRGVEILSYQLVSDLQTDEGANTALTDLPRPSGTLMVDVHEVQAILKKSPDLTAQFVASKLTAAIDASNFNRDYNLVYAPVLTREDVGRVLETISDPIARANALEANDIVHILGDGQSILDSNLEEDSNQLKKARELLGSVLSTVGDHTDAVNFYLTMELCYADLLAARITRDSKKKQAILRHLADQYAELAVRYAHFRSAVLHYRRSIVLHELGMGNEAYSEIGKAISLQKFDESTGPGHWVRGTMLRRMALFFAGQAHDLLIELEKDPENRELRAEYLDWLKKAFNTVYDGFEEDSKGDSHRAMLEARRRLNNIVYYAALYARGGGRLSELHDGFSAKKLEIFVERLQAGRVAKVSDLGMLHTIGAAFEVLNKTNEAGAIADRLWEMISKTGLDPNSRETRQVMADAMRWKQARNSTLEATVQ